MLVAPDILSSTLASDLTVYLVAMSDPSAGEDGYCDMVRFSDALLIALSPSRLSTLALLSPYSWPGSP